MIRYALTCPDAHAFDSWFASAAAFDTLTATGMLSCPVCGSASVQKALMAPVVRPARQQVARQGTDRLAAATDAATRHSPPAGPATSGFSGGQRPSAPAAGGPGHSTGSRKGQPRDVDDARSTAAKGGPPGTLPMQEPSDRDMALAALRHHVETTAEYVGSDFAAEARAIHAGDEPGRPIWGEAAPEDARRLIEDGIAVMPLPFRPTRKMN